MSTKLLPIENLQERHPCVTLGQALNYYETASVCFNRHHTSPLPLRIKVDSDEILVQVLWRKVTWRLRFAWRNQKEATEDGACCCALAAMELTKNLVSIGRADTGSGVDFYMVPVSTVSDDDFDDDSDGDFEAAFVVEVSGTDRGADNDIRERLKKKHKQVKEGDENLPAYVCVVAFKEARIVIEVVDVE